MAGVENGSAANDDAAWKNDDYIPSLRRLHELQAQLDNLRQAIPNIVSSVAAPPTSTVSTGRVYAEFAGSAMKAVKDIKQLREGWEDKGTTRILEHTRQSLGKDPEVAVEFSRRGRLGEVPTIEDNATSLEVKMEQVDVKQE